MLMYSTFLQEPELIAMAYDLEQELHALATTAIAGIDHSDSERGVVHGAASAAGQGASASRPASSKVRGGPVVVTSIPRASTGTTDQNSIGDPLPGIVS
jgi:hypothetical protein